MIVNKQRFD